MNIKTIVVGCLQTNCYILEKEDNIIIIDPGDEAKKISQNILSDKKVLGIIVTHSHDDHTGALKELLNKYKTSLYDYHNLTEGHHTLGCFNFECIYTPGHLDDSITIYFEKEKVMFVGDFIFKGSIGRTDLFGANTFDMKQSIKKILNYKSDIVLYPGHFASTTLGDERDTLNYFLNLL